MLTEDDSKEYSGGWLAPSLEGFASSSVNSTIVRKKQQGLAEEQSPASDSLRDSLTKDQCSRPRCSATDRGGLPPRRRSAMLAEQFHHPLVRHLLKVSVKLADGPERLRLEQTLHVVAGAGWRRSGQTPLSMRRESLCANFTCGKQRPDSGPSGPVSGVCPNGHSGPPSQRTGRLRNGS